MERDELYSEAFHLLGRLPETWPTGKIDKDGREDGNTPLPGSSLISRCGRSTSSVKSVAQSRVSTQRGTYITRSFTALELAGSHLLPLGFSRSPRGRAQDLCSSPDDSEVQHG